MNDELDAGPILRQENFSLLGSLEEIFKRISKLGILLTKDILKNGMNPIVQDHSLATFCKRRTPEQSEVTIEELKNKDSKYLYNKVRMLQSPYPSAFVMTADGKKLIIKEVFVQEDS